jgi:ABC-type sugar transport system substrate-binding protein
MKKLFRITAILLVLMLTASLPACGSKSTGEPSASPSPSENTPASAAPVAESDAPQASPSSAAAAPAKAGIYDSSFDYSSRPSKKICYMMSMQTTAHTAAIDSFRLWAEKMNCVLTTWDAAGSNDLFITSIETQANNGMDGLILDPDTSTYDRVMEVCEEVGVNWMPGMGGPFFYDESGRKIVGHPYITFDDFEQGQKMMDYMTNYKEKTWPDVSWDNVGVLWVDFSGSPQIHDLGLGMQNKWDETHPDNKSQFYTVDGVIGSLDSATSYNLVVATVPKYDYDYWLILNPFDDYSIGCARAMESLGKQDKCAITNRGGAGVITQWDADEQDSIVAVYYTAATLVTEYTVAGLYAFVHGDATPETIWPEWVDHSNNETYAHIMNDSVWLTYDDYKHYLEWTDLYTNTDSFHYDVDVSIDDFNPRATPPAYYAG